MVAVTNNHTERSKRSKAVDEVRHFHEFGVTCSGSFPACRVEVATLEALIRPRVQNAAQMYDGVVLVGSCEFSAKPETQCSPICEKRD